MKLLVTGASGFVGGNAAVLLGKDHTVYSLYGRNLPEQRVLAASADAFACDLTEQEKLEELLHSIEPDCLLHCAALSRPAQCEANPLQAEAINYGGSDALCRAASSLQRKPLLVFCSSDLVFDGCDAPEGGHRETAFACPQTVYAKTKLAAEQLFLDYQGPASIFRLSLVYGPRIQQTQGFLGWMRTRLEAGEICDLFADEWRTPVSVHDISAALKACLLRHAQERDVPAVLNLAGAERLSRYEFGQRLCRVGGYPEELLHKSSQHTFSNGPPRTSDASLNTELLCQILGRSPLTVAQGLALCELR